MRDVSRERMWHDLPKLGIFLMLISICIHTTGALFEKLLLDVYQVPQIAFTRAFFRLIPLFFTLLKRKEIRAILVVQQPWIHLLRIVAYITYTYFILYAISKTTLSMISAIQYITPFFTIAFSVWFLKEKMNRHKWIAIGLTTIGVLVALRPSGQFELLLLLTLFATISGSLNKILIRKLTATEHSLTITLFGNLAIVLVSIPALLIDWHPLSWHDVGCFAIASVLTSTAQFLSVQALRFAPASTVAMLDCTSIIWATLYDFWIWSVIPNSYIILGSVIIIGSNFYVFKTAKANFQKKKESS